LSGNEGREISLGLQPAKQRLALLPVEARLIATEQEPSRRLLYPSPSTHAPSGSRDAAAALQSVQRIAA
jgi:hypothetical protein